MSYLGQSGACLPFAALRVRFLGPLDTLVGLAGAVFMSGILYLTVLVVLNRLNLYNLAPSCHPACGNSSAKRI